MNFATSLHIERGNSELQDRAEIFQSGERLVIAVADGAGGIAGGAQAAEFFIRSVHETAADLTSAQHCSQLMETIDRKLSSTASCGETTGIIAVIGRSGLYGAHVGDSDVWLFSSSHRQQLTNPVLRKPFLGSGAAFAFNFARDPLDVTLIAATDGLWKYTSIDLIGETVRTNPLNQLAVALANLVRLRSGALSDDIAIATCRITA